LFALVGDGLREGDVLWAEAAAAADDRSAGR
jgi:hypothetical protein